MALPPIIPPQRPAITTENTTQDTAHHLGAQPSGLLQTWAKGIRVKALQTGEPVVYASVLLGMIRGIGATALTRGGLRVADSADAIVTVFLHGAAR